MQINISKKQERVLKKIFQTDNIEAWAQKIIDDQIVHEIQVNYPHMVKKTIDDMLNDLDK